MSTNLPAAVRAQDEAADAIVAGITPPTEPPKPAEPPAAPPAAEPQASEPKAEDWQHKYLSLQGVFNKTTADLKAEIADLKKQMTERAPAPTPPADAPPAAPATPATKLVTDTDVDNFGADLVDLMRRVSQETNADKVTALEAEITRLKGLLPDLQNKVTQVTTTVADEARAKYFSDLKAVVPDYEAIDVDDAFLGWLTLTDPLSGNVRNTLLLDAYGKFDVTRTAAIFNAFKQETGRTTPQPPPKNPLEAEVSPGTSRAATPVATDGERVWTGAEVQEFYTAVTRGDYRHDPDKAKAIDAEIDRAFAAGRVR